MLDSISGPGGNIAIKQHLAFSQTPHLRIEAMRFQPALLLFLSAFLVLRPADTGPAAPLDLVLEASSRKVTGLALGSMHLSIFLAEGHASRVLEGGKPVGIYFKGKGVFEYSTQDKIESAAFAFNVTKNTSGQSLTNDGSVGIQSALTELFILDSDAAAVLAPDESGPAQARDFEEFRKPFETSFAAPLAHHMAIHRNNAPSAKLSWAEIRGASGKFRYAFDPFVSRVERMEVLVTDPHSRRGIPVLISEQPVGWNRKQPLASTATLMKVDLDVVASAGESVRIRATETYRSNTTALRLLTLSLISNPLHEELHLGSKARQYRLLSLKDEEGKDVPFDHRNDQVVVLLSKPLASGQSTTLTFEMEGDLLHRPGGDNYWKLGVYSWFPMPEALDGQFFTIQAAISVPKPYLPFASGITLQRSEAGDRNTLKVKLDTPTQFFSIQAGKYRMKEETRDGLTVRIATYADVAANPQKLLNLTFQIVDFYKSMLGPFPYPEFNIIQMNQWGYGQAPPAFMLITNEAFVRIKESSLSFDDEGRAIETWSFEQAVSNGINRRFAHEIAHQYWGHVVKMANLEEQWITESFSEYCAALALRRFRRFDESYFKGQIATWKRLADEATKASSIATANRIATFPRFESSSKRKALIYDKGAYLLAQIHLQVGDVKFVRFLRTLLGTKGWNFATTQDVVDILKSTTGKDFSQLFEACYWGTAMPEEVK